MRFDFSFSAEGDGTAPRAIRLTNGTSAEHFDAAILKPQSTELGGFILIQGTREQIDALRTDRGFEAWVTQIQLVADRVGIVDAWVGGGLGDAFALYEEALRKL